MKIETQLTRQFVRTTILAALVAVLAMTTVQNAGAQQSKIATIYDNAIGQAALCELFGGTPVIEETHTENGYPANTVTCFGGLLDGMVCANNSAGTACHFALFAPELDENVVAPIDVIDVAPEPTQPPIIIDESVVIEPVVDSSEDAAEATAEPVEPTPEPTAGPIVDGGEVVDEIAPPTEGTDDGGRELPEIQDGVVIEEIVAPEPDNKGTDDGRVIELKVDADVIASDPVVAGP